MVLSGSRQFTQNCGNFVPHFGEIVKGPDGFLWYTSTFGIRRMDVSGNYTTFPLTCNGGNDTPIAIVVGGDSALWATSFARLIYRLTTSGTMTFYPIPWSAAGGCTALVDIALGPDDEVWFTDGCYASLWYGVWAPAKTPDNIIARLNAAAVAALADPTVRKRLADLGQDVPPLAEQTPQALGARQKAEIEKWWPIIKAANIRTE
jgi:streptogramin lyase